MAEKHRAPDERRFDPDAAGDQQRDGMRASQDQDLWVRNKSSIPRVYYKLAPIAPVVMC